MSSPSPESRSDASQLIEAVVDKYTDDLIELRRDLHAHPELSWHERRTTDVVAGRLAFASFIGKEQIGRNASTRGNVRDARLELLPITS